MPYIIRTSIVGDVRKVEYLPPGPAEVGKREEYPSGEHLRVKIMRDQDLAQSASKAADEAAIPPGVEGVTVEEIRELQAEDRGLGSFHAHYQQFRKR